MQGLAALIDGRYNARPAYDTIDPWRDGASAEEIERYEAEENERLAPKFERSRVPRGHAVKVVYGYKPLRSYARSQSFAAVVDMSQRAARDDGFIFEQEIARDTTFAPGTPGARTARAMLR